MNMCQLFKIHTAIMFAIFKEDGKLDFLTDTAQRIKLSVKDFFSKCEQIRRKLRIWSHLLKKSLMANFIFCAVRIIKT